MMRVPTFRLTGATLLLLALTGCPSLTSPQVDQGLHDNQVAGAATNLAAHIPGNLSSSSGVISNSLSPTISGNTLAGAKVALFGQGPGLSIMSLIGHCTGTVLASSVADALGNFALTSRALTGGDGAYSLFVQASDDFGNTVCSSAFTYSIDTASPIIGFGAPSASPINSSGSSTVAITFTHAGGTTLTNGSTAGLTHITTGGADCTVTLSGVSTAGATATFTACSGTGTVAIKVNAGTVTAPGGTPNALSGASATVTVNNTAPTVSFGAPSASPINSSSSSTIALTFTGAASTTLANGSTAGLTHVTTGGADCTATLSGVSASAATVTLTACSGTGTVAIKVSASTLANNAGTPNALSAASSAVTVNNTAPTVGFGAPSASPINSSGSSTIALTFTGAASTTLANGSTAGLTHVTTGGADCTATLSGVSASAATVTLTACSGTGTVAIEVNASTLANNAGTPNVLSAASSAVTVNNTAPTVGFGAPVTNPMNSSGSSTIALTFSGAGSTTLTNGDAGDLTLVTTGTVNSCTTAFSAVSSASATVTVSNCAGDGTVAIELNAGTLANNAGTPNVLSAASGTITVDNTGPIVASFSQNTGSFSAATFPTSIDVTMSADTDMTTLSTVVGTNFSLGGSCGGATIGAITKPGGVVATITLAGTGTCTDGQTVILNYIHNGVADTLGNPSITDASRTYTMDIFTRTAVGGDVTGGGIYNSASDSFINVTFSKTVSNASIAGITSMSCTGAGAVAITPVVAGDASTVQWTLPAPPHLAADTCTITISGVTDPAGVAVDASTPTAVLTSVTD